MSEATATPAGLADRLPTLVGMAAIAVLIAGLGIWATQTQIAGAVVSSGRVIVDRNRQAVQHLEGGVVQTVLAREGDTVTKGDTLARLDPTLPLSELGIIESRLFEVMARRGRLEAERDGASAITFDPELLAQSGNNGEVDELMHGQTALFDARLETLHRSISQLENRQLQLKNQIDGIDAMTDSLQSQIALTEEETAAQEDLLDRGLAQGSRVLNLRREVARLSGSIGETTARRAQALESIAEIEIELLKLQSQRREEAIGTLRDLQVNEMELAERRYALHTQLSRLEIKAPVSGVIYDLRLLGEQSVIRPAEPLMFIVPQDRPMQIEARVSPININAVAIGQEVVIRFRSFDMRETPDLFGKVTLVSPDAFADTATGETYYRIEVELPEAEMSKLAADQVVIPGMPVDAFLRTGEYSPLTYLMQPLARYFGTAMRDGG